MDREIPDSPPDLTAWIRAAGDGDGDARSRLFQHVYNDLRVLAHRRLRGTEGTLDASSLVHEAFVKMFGDRLTSIDNRRHFFGIAGCAMRDIIVEHVRRQNTLKRGAGKKPVRLGQVKDVVEADLAEILHVRSAMEKLNDVAPESARIVNLRYFAGFTLEETARALELSVAQVRRHWAYARAFLRAALSDR